LWPIKLREHRLDDEEVEEGGGHERVRYSGSGSSVFSSLVSTLLPPAGSEFGGDEFNQAIVSRNPHLLSMHVCTYTPLVCHPLGKLLGWVSHSHGDSNPQIVAPKTDPVSNHPSQGLMLLPVVAMARGDVSYMVVAWVFMLCKHAERKHISNIAVSVLINNNPL
jgi:hypothetical protein